MFDMLYVLAKGGICVYSGLPQDLKTFLNKCDINLTENQFPIEVLLKIASNVREDKDIKLLENKTLEEKQIIQQKCKNKTKLSENGIPFKSKNFKFIDMWYLLIRSMTNAYVSQWKLLLTQLLFFIFCPLIIAKTFNEDIGKPDGCFNLTFISSKTCLKQLEDDSLVDQNLKFHAFTSVLVMLIQICVTTLTFPLEIKIFMNEHQNSEL